MFFKTFIDNKITLLIKWLRTDKIKCQNYFEHKFFISPDADAAQVLEAWQPAIVSGSYDVTCLLTENVLIMLQKFKM